MKIIRIITAVIAVMLCCTPFTASAEEDFASKYFSEGYVIEEYTVSAKATDKNVYKVEEIIAVNFTLPSRGIYRQIPTVTQLSKKLITRLNLSGIEYSTYLTPVSNISVSAGNNKNEEYKTYYEDTDIVIRIGNEDKYINGSKTYYISYEIDFGEDYTSDCDFIAYNIIGRQWSTGIKKLDFNIEMPKSSALFTPEIYVNETPAKTDIRSDNMSVSGSITNIDAYTPVMVVSKLEDGYFNTQREGNTKYYVIIVASLFAVAAAIFMYYRYGKDPRVPVPVEVTPPDGIDSAMAGFIADGTADTKDIISLIVYWADKGNLEIIDTSGDISLVSKNPLPEDAPVYQKKLYQKLFNERNMVKLSSLKDTFYTHIERAKSTLKDKGNTLVSDKKANKKRVWSYITALLPFVTALCFTLFSGLPFEVAAGEVFVVGFLAAFAAIVYLFAYIVIKKWNVYGSVKRTVLIVLLLAIILAIIMLTGTQIGSVIFDRRNVMRYASLSTFVCLVISLFSGRRSVKGARIFARVIGFRNFIVKAEKSRLEMLVNENPNYFYNVLPYAYSLGVSDKWMKQFESIAIEPPSWYSTNTFDTFSVFVFYSSLNRATTQMSSTMTSRPASESSRSFGGGGGGSFGGGGFGGGGGGRW